MLNFDLIYPSRKQIVCIIFIIVLLLISFLIFLEKQFPIKSNQFDLNFESRVQNFYAQDFSGFQNIVLIGSSHIGFINSTFVEKEIQRELSADYRIFNLGKSGDRPIDRFIEIEKIVNMKPELVIYGISYRDFPIVYSNDFILSEIHEVLSQLINDGEDFVNPQLFTRYSILNHGFAPEPSQPHCFYQSNFPLMQYCPNFSNRVPEEKLLEMYEPIKNGSFEENKMALLKMIDRFDSLDVKFILIITPVHQIYLDDLSIQQKNSFEKLLSDIKFEHENIEIYDFRHQYDDEFVWQTPSHIAISNGSVFDIGILEIILEVIN